MTMGSRSLPLLWFLVEGDDAGSGSALLMAAISILACIVLACWYRWQRPWAGLPRPVGLPIVGNLPLLMLLTQKLPMHQALWQLSERHGALMGLRLGSVPVLVASTPEAARLVLQTHDRELSGRAPTMAASLFFSLPDLGATDIIFSQPGPYWKLLRQLCTTHLFSTERILSFGPLIREEVHLMLSSILEAEKQDVIIRHRLHKCTNNIISRMSFGKRLEELCSPLSGASHAGNFMDTLIEAIHYLGVINIADFLPWLEWMDLQGHNHKMKAISTRLTEFVHDIIDSRRKSRASLSKRSTTSDTVDFLDILLDMVERTKDNEMPVVDGHVKAVLMDMFGAGTDTSAITAEWALAELVANKDQLRLVEEELDRVVGHGGEVEISDLANMPYLSAVVKETMRLHPVAPLLIPHRAMQSCEVGGYGVVQGTQVMVNVWAIGRDPSVWENPLRFHPERFMESHLSNIAIHGQSFGFLPFGSGRRICPARKLGFLSVQLIVADLVQRIDLRHSMVPKLAESRDVVSALESPLIVKACPKLQAQPPAT